MFASLHTVDDDESAPATAAAIDDAAEGDGNEAGDPRNPRLGPFISVKMLP
jgi:hypothetical protein